MHHKLIIVLLFLLLFNSANTQSLYHIQYNFHSLDDTTTYNVFLIRYDNGTGTARIKYRSPATSQDVVIEMVAEEQTATDATVS